MPRKTHRHFSKCAAFIACSLLGAIAATPSRAQNAPAPAAAAPAVFVAPSTVNRFFKEIDELFAAKNYASAAAKIQELLPKLSGNPNAPFEQLYFNIGLAHLLAQKPAQAEAAFVDHLKRYPKGEYASKANLGLGRALLLQKTPEKKQLAIEPLKRAAADPKNRAEAGLILGQVYTDLGKREEAMVVFHSLTGSDVRSPQQTNAAVGVIGLLADAGKLEDLISYLDHLRDQSGVRNAICWYVNQLIVRGDELVGSQSYEPALAIYRFIPPYSQILEIQKMTLEVQRRDQKQLENKVKAEEAKPMDQRSIASELLSDLKPAIELIEKALVAVEGKVDLDSMVLMRRARCLYHLNRLEEALVCFRTMRTKYSTAPDAKSAAYAEIVIQNKLQNIPAMKTLCDAYVRKYPNAENVEQVAALAGEILVQSGKWDEVSSFYRNLETKFPQSESLDRYTFFQGVAAFQGGNFKESAPIFTQFLKKFPSSSLVENALYYVAMSNFLTNQYKKTLASCAEYLSRFPDGRFAGDMRYRLSFIDFNDKETDQTDKIIADLTKFLDRHPNDSAAGSMHCLLADSYKKKKSNKTDEMAKFEKLAFESYQKATETDSTDDVIQYALDSATALLQGNKDWAGVAALHSGFLKRKPSSPLALMSATEVAKMKVREGKGAEAAEMLANSLKSRMNDPASEQVEFLIDELVKTLVPPRKKAVEVDLDAIDRQLLDILNKAIGGRENATTSARVYYARARLAQLLKRADRSDLYLKGIATINSKDPSVLSPALLSVSGDILLKLGNLDGAEAMFQRLSNRYQDGMFADAGPVGLGYIALARKKPADALKIFETALDTNPGMSRFKETTLGKLEALAALGQFEPAEKLALEIVGDKMFRGESAGKAYLILARIHRTQAEKAVGVDARLELLKKAYATYQRVYVAYQSTPEICAEAYWQAYEVAIAMDNQELANETIKALAANPKLQNTERAKKAIEFAK